MIVLKEFLRLTTEKRNLNEKLENIEKSLKELESGVIDHMADEGIQSINIDGYSLYIHKQIRASCLNTKIMKQYEHQLVKETVNANTLAAWVREQLEDGEWERDDQGSPVVPEELREAIKVTEQISARARKL
jgi:hypothetical protein